MAERLHVDAERIVALENTDLGRLPSRMYVRDLVGEYAREVGLDPRQLVERYLAEFDAPFPGPATFADVAARPRPRPAPRSVGQPEDVLLNLPLRAEVREHAPVRDSPVRYYRSGSALGFVAGAAAGVIGVGALLYLGGVNLYPAGAPPSIAERQQDQQPPSTRSDESGAASRASDDDPRAAEPPRDEVAPPATPDASSVGQASASAPARSDREPPDARAPVSDARPVAPAAESVTAEERAAADAPAASDAPPAVDAPATPPASDLGGVWYVTNRVEAADYSRYKNMTLGFQLTLRQRGTQVVGEGYKFSENGKPLQARRRTPIAVEGHLDGEQLVLNFTERGAARTSAGRFVLQMADDGSLRGRFTSNAAGSSGSSIAIRQRRRS